MEEWICLCGQTPCDYPYCAKGLVDTTTINLKRHTGAVKLSTKAKIAIGKKRGSQRAIRIAREFYKP